MLTSGIILALTTTKVLRKGCEAFLAHVVSIESDAPNLANISMVHSFSDIFPEDLPALPPIGELEFGIGLAAVTRPISRTIYRITPTELKELKKDIGLEWFE